MASKVLRDDELSLRYYGKAFDEHSISAKNLAASLLHFSDAVNDASKSVDSKFKVELQVTAQRAGSFDIVFLFEHSLESVGKFAQTDAGQALSFIVNIGVPAFFIGVVKLAVNRIKHGAPKIEEQAQNGDDVLFNDDHITLTYPDGTQLETTRLQLRVSENSDFVKNIGEAFTVPTDDGYDGVEITTQHDCFSVSAKEAQVMKEYIPTEDIIDESDITMHVQPLSANFENNKKWKLTTGNGESFTAEITDETFYARLDEGLQVGKKDILKVLAHTVSSRDKRGKLNVKYTITRVLKYIPYTPPTQGAFDFSS